MRAHRVGVAASVGAAVLWIVLAWRSPTSTHHFAPLVVAGVWGFLTRKDNLPAPSRSDRLVMLGGGLAVAMAAFVLLAASGRLDGPELVAPVPVLVELPLMAVIGAVVGSGAWCLVTNPRPAD